MEINEVLGLLELGLLTTIVVLGGLMCFNVDYAIIVAEVILSIALFAILLILQSEANAAVVKSFENNETIFCEHSDFLWLNTKRASISKVEGWSNNGDVFFNNEMSYDIQNCRSKRIKLKH